MRLSRHRDVRAQIHELLAREELSRGYPREALLEDFEHVRSLLEAEDRDAAEDDVVSVMDVLVGWCSPHLKL